MTHKISITNAPAFDSEDPLLDEVMSKAILSEDGSYMEHFFTQEDEVKPYTLGGLFQEEVLTPTGKRLILEDRFTAGTPDGLLRPEQREVFQYTWDGASIYHFQAKSIFLDHAAEWLECMLITDAMETFLLAESEVLEAQLGIEGYFFTDLMGFMADHRRPLPDRYRCGQDDDDDMPF